MARLQCFALTCLLAAVLPAMASAQNCGLREFASIDLLSNEDGMPIVEMQIGGRTVHLLVDTGGVYSSINSDVADALRVSQHDIANGMEVYGAGGERYKTYIEAPDFKLGAIALDKFPMMVAHHALTGAGVDGTLAPDFLSRFEVDFDFGAHKLNFFAPDHCPGKVVYWSKAYVEIPFKIDAITHVAVPMTLDGHQTVATIDTGANLTTLSDAMARSVFGLSETSPGMEAIPSAKTRRSFSVSLQVQDAFSGWFGRQQSARLHFARRCRKSFSAQSRCQDGYRRHLWPASERSGIGAGHKCSVQAAPVHFLQGKGALFDRRGCPSMTGA